MFRLMYFKGITVVAGCPSKLYDEEDIDWAPTIKLGHQKVKPISDSALRRQKRSTERDRKRRHSEAALALLSLHKEPRLSEESGDLFIEGIKEQHLYF